MLTGCNRPLVTGGSGDFQGGNGNGIDVLTWATGKVFDVQGSSVTRAHTTCPSGSAQVDFVGTVVSASGRWTPAFVHKTVSFDACLTIGLTIVVVELAPGTSFRIG
jgi:hypothetical protein